VTRQRDRRRFGRGPYVLGLRKDPRHWGEAFPFEVPAVAAIEDLRLDTPVTLLAGDNGSGKSTIVVPRPALGGGLVPVLAGAKPRYGYFLRAESFFNVARFVDSGGVFAPDLSLYGDRPLHQQSHGQSFLALAGNRFGGEGLYILDEPEAALSVSGALALVGVLVRAARAGAQFVIATHSPVLLACPGARIYELDGSGLAPCAYDELEAVRFARGFLEAPDRFIRAVLEEREA
jgi:predicted ATPase